MLRNICRMIFGVSDSTDTIKQRLAKSEPEVRYMPASNLTERQIHGVGSAGDTWTPWRMNADGEQWYQRVSSAAPVAPERIFSGDDNDALHCDVPGTGGRVADGFEDCDYEA
jgi:hypothetical protein